MSNYINTTNMSLPVPTIGLDPGPDYASNINACMTLIDSHDHTPGFGVPITPAAININQDLSFINNNATNIKSLTLIAQSAISTSLSVYVKGVDLYYRDGNGTEIPITVNGSVDSGNGNITGLPNGTAGVNYSSSVYTFSEATNTPANIAIGSLLLGNNTALSDYVTIKPPNSIPVGGYTLTMPTKPAATKFVTIDSTGAFASSVAYPLTSTDIASNTVTSSNIASNTIARSNMVSGIGEYTVAEYTATGAHTLVLPSNVTSIYAQVQGGGGGGGAGADSNGGSANDGGGGGQGGGFEEGMLKVTGGATINITVGTGGTGGTGNAGNGFAGTNSSVNVAGDTSQLIGQGGAGGGGGNFTLNPGAGVATSIVYNRTAQVKLGSGVGGTGAGAASAGSSGILFQGGQPGQSRTAGGGGGGGASVYGNGGNGGIGGDGSGGSGPGSAPGATAYGAGGGGGGANSLVIETSQAGGAGMAGIVRIYYVQ